MIRIMSFTAIGRKYNVSDNAIRNWCDSYELPRKVSDIKAINDEDWSKIWVQDSSLAIIPETGVRIPYEVSSNPIEIKQCGASQLKT